MSHPLSARFRSHSANWSASGAPTYASLAARLADELDARPSDWDLVDTLAPFIAEPPGRLLPTRLMAASHEWALRGGAPALAEHYASCGGVFRESHADAAWEAFRTALLARRGDLPAMLARPGQHNEVGRAAALAAGFLTVAAHTGLPMRLLEVGSSAGLLLRWDHYLPLPWMKGLLVAADYRPVVLDRLGCDLHPISPFTVDGLYRLRSFVWTDMVENMRMLEEAVEIARTVPAHVDQADGADWISDMLSDVPSGAATVVFHSMMETWSPSGSMDRMRAAILEAAEWTDASAVLAYLRLEVPDAGVPPDQMAQVVLTMWPRGEERTIATCDINGRHLRWSAEAVAQRA